MLALFLFRIQNLQLTWSHCGSRFGRVFVVISGDGEGFTSDGSKKCY